MSFSKRAWGGCAVGWADESFACTYPPATGQCPSCNLRVSGGETYSLLVTSNGACAGTDAGYKLLVASSFDPTLTLAADNQRVSLDAHIVIDGTASVPAKP